MQPVLEDELLVPQKELRKEPPLEQPLPDNHLPEEEENLFVTTKLVASNTRTPTLKQEQDIFNSVHLVSRADSIALILPVVSSAGTQREQLILAIDQFATDLLSFVFISLFK